VNLLYPFLDDFKKLINQEKFMNDSNDEIIDKVSEYLKESAYDILPMRNITKTIKTHNKKSPF